MMRHTVNLMPLVGAALCGAIAALVGCAITPDTASQSGSSQIGAGQKQEGRSQKAVNTHTPAAKEIATLAGGCFWCTEAIFRELKGVDSVVPGYAGGSVASPSYEQVCTGTTGHAETIQIEFNPKVISFHDLLRIFFTTHDPTTLNQQGADHGTQYRSAVFYHTAAQQETAVKVIHEITEAHIWPNRIVTEVTPYKNFYPAEDYHKNYFERNPYNGYCRIVIEPKVAKFRDHYRALLKK